MFTGIKQKIIISNLLGLPFIFIALLIINSERTTLIDLQIQALFQQAKTISAILTERSSGRYNIKKGRLVRAEKNIKQGFYLRRPILGGHSDALLFDARGNIIEDSRQHLPGKITSMPLADIDKQGKSKSRYQILYERIFRLLYQSNVTDHILFEDNEGAFGADFIEFNAAVMGNPAAVLRINSYQQTILSVAVPVRRLGKVLGVLKISTSNEAIMRAVKKERQMLVQLFIIAAILSITISYLLARGIAKPLGELTRNVHLAEQSNFRPNKLQAVNVRKLNRRNDEIGSLSKAFDRLMKTLKAHFSDIECFAADVAHELKNPLTSLNSALDIIQYIDNPDKKIQLLKVAKHDIKRIDRLIGDISNLSRIDAEMYREHYETINLVSMLNDLVMHYQGSALANDINVVFHCAHHTVLFSAIAERLGSVFSNIIENALSFTSEGDNIDVFLEKIDQKIIIKITDTGTGIPEDSLDKIFNRFYSDRPDHKSFGNHSGLGLAIVKRIVESHNGNIIAYNRTDKQDGAVFKIVF
ncbi:MAG: two-component system sensor histidine kinase ChvG [Dasania sp.]|jgi:two-component system sensor histidine kinase ChvG